MNTMTKIKAADAIIVLAGRGKAQREMAFMSIAPLSFTEAKCRTETIANLRIALGSSPTDNELRVATDQWIIGRVANRLPAGEFPKGTSETIDKLDFASDLVLFYAAPPKEGAKARKLRKGQKGRRSVVQHRVIRAAEEAWSQVKAELGLGNAKTQSERNTAKKARAPHRNNTSAPPTHNALVTPDKPMTADEAHQHIVTQMTALVAYTSKHAKLIETGFSMPVIACHKAVVAADAERRVRINTKAAEAR